MILLSTKNSFLCTIDNKNKFQLKLVSKKDLSHTIHSLLAKKLYSIIVCGGHLGFMLITGFPPKLNIFYIPILCSDGPPYRMFMLAGQSRDIFGAIGWWRQGGPRGK